MDENRPVIIVTGASAGIGAATVRRLATAGANVVLVARREQRLHELVAACAGDPGRRLVVGCDVSTVSCAGEVVEQTLAAFGRIDVLINNAGHGHYVNLADLPVATAHSLVHTNLLGPLYLIQAVLPPMLTAGHGQIINVSSIVGERPLPRMALYCASKAALNALSRGLRLELAGTPIRVSTVYPGRTRTEFGDAAYGQGASSTGLGQVSADRVARAIEKATRTGRPEIYVTPYDWLFTNLNRLFPRSIDWMVMQWVKYNRSRAA